MPAFAVFRGLLWPLAWLWAYTKPVFHKMAYGTDVADHEITPAEPQIVTDDKIRPLRQPIGDTASEGVTAEEVQALRLEIAHLEERLNARPKVERRELERS